MAKKMFILISHIYLLLCLMGETELCERNVSGAGYRKGYRLPVTMHGAFCAAATSHLIIMTGRIDSSEKFIVQ